MYSFSYLFILFMCYSVFGYLIEIFYCSIISNKIIINRGFLIGPYLPIYGSSAVIMYLVLSKYENDPVALFIMSCVVCTIIEYFTSLVLEKIFKLRWWDYSEMKLNIDGRVCLLNSLLFGGASLFQFYFLNPFVFDFIDRFTPKDLEILTSILFVIFLTDFVISVSVLVKIKLSSIKFSHKDVSSELIALRNQKLKENSLLFKRLLNAFPKMSGKNLDIYVDIKNKVNEFRELQKKEKEKLKLKKKKEL